MHCREINPNEFLENRLWTFGPFWLRGSELTWPQSKIPGLSELPETKTVQCLLTRPDTWGTRLINVINSYSSYTRLKSHIAYWLMVFKRYRAQRVKALQKAESTIVRIIQLIEFSREMDCLKNNKPLDERNRITPLDPFIDSDGVLRVRARIRKAVLSFSKKHPMILPANCHLTKIIIRYYHHNNLHTGVQNTLYALREKFWLIDGRNQVKMVIKNCVACFRANPTLCK